MPKQRCHAALQGAALAVVVCKGHLVVLHFQRLKMVVLLQDFLGRVLMVDGPQRVVDVHLLIHGGQSQRLDGTKFAQQVLYRKMQMRIGLRT